MQYEMLCYTLKSMEVGLLALGLSDYCTGANLMMGPPVFKSFARPVKTRLLFLD